jgi:hypothetical protein
MTEVDRELMDKMSRLVKSVEALLNNGGTGDPDQILHARAHLAEHVIRKIPGWVTNPIVMGIKKSRKEKQSEQNNFLANYLSTEIPKKVREKLTPEVFLSEWSNPKERQKTQQTQIIKAFRQKNKSK